MTLERHVLFEENSCIRACFRAEIVAASVPGLLNDRALMENDLPA
jgi:hypothetical protein